MKRFLSIIFAVILLVGTVGCSGGDTKNTVNSSTADASASASGESSAVPAATTPEPKEIVELE